MSNNQSVPEFIGENSRNVKLRCDIARKSAGAPVCELEVVSKSQIVFEGPANGRGISHLDFINKGVQQSSMRFKSGVPPSAGLVREHFKPKRDAL
jgi:hypothetical protein